GACVRSFFFQAEDGIRDFHVTGVQTCALPICELSGGERARLILARVLARPANLLVLDEPTNDLDMETLELLQELVAGFAGTVIQIGRASCRERVMSSGAHGSIRTQQEW